MGIDIVAKFDTDWSIFADAKVLTKSNMANFLIQRQITRTVLVRLVPLKNSSEILQSYTIISAEFGADWLIFVDARVLTRKLWTDGRRTDGRTTTGGE